jgi:hypothetical protein
MTSRPGHFIYIVDEPALLQLAQMPAHRRRRQAERVRELARPALTPRRSLCSGVSSPPPSAAQVPERVIVELAVHEQRDLDLIGQRCRTDFVQE